MATFGQTTIGGTNEALAADTKRACKFTAPSGIGAIDEIFVYANRSGTGGGYAIRGAIYADNAGVPDAGVVNSPIEISSNIARNTPQWYGIAYTTKPTLTPSATYWLVVQANKAIDTYYDAGAANQEATLADAYFDGLVDPFGSGSTMHSHVMSIYVTYTPAGQTHLLAGVIAGVAAATGAAAVLKTLVGSVAGIASVSGAAAILRTLSGAVAGVASVSGATAILRALSGTVAGVASVSGATAIAKRLAGAVSGAATSTGALTVGVAAVLLAGLSAGLASASGAISVARKLAGTVAGLATVTGATSIGRTLAGLAAGVATSTGAASIARKLAGIIAGVGSAIASLTSGPATKVPATLSGISHARLASLSIGHNHAAALSVGASRPASVTTGLEGGNA